MPKKLKQVRNRYILFKFVGSVFGWLKYALTLSSLSFCGLLLPAPQTELEVEVTQDLEDSAETLVESEMDDMDEVVEEEEEAGFPEEHIQEDVRERENESIERVRSGIRKKYETIQGNLRHKRADVEKHILEQRYVICSAMRNELKPRAFCRVVVCRGSRKFRGMSGFHRYI